MRSARDALLAVSVALILAFTLVPRHGLGDREFVPFRDVVTAARYADGAELGRSLLDDVANVLLFVPLGQALALRGWSVRRTLVGACALSLAIELAQLTVIAGRTAATSDVLLNTSGALLGYALLTMSRRRGWLRSAERAQQ